jgi:hypothetical protein
MGDLEDDHFSTTSVTLHVYDLCQILGRKDPKINGNQKKLSYFKIRIKNGQFFRARIVFSLKHQRFLIK